MSCKNCSGTLLADCMPFHLMARRVTQVHGKPIRLEPGINRLALDIPSCCDDPEEASLVIMRHQRADFVMYRGFERDEEGRIVFLLDDTVFNLPAGRWLGSIACACCCHLIQFELPGCGPIKSVELDHQPDLSCLES